MEALREIIERNPKLTERNVSKNKLISGVQIEYITKTNFLSTNHIYKKEH